MDRRLPFALLMIAAGCSAPRQPVPPPPVLVAPVAPPAIVAAPPPPAVSRAPVTLCERGVQIPGPDGRLLGHLPYPDMPASALIPAPDSFAPGGSCRVHPAVLPDLQRLIAAADADPAVAGTLRAVSCHRGAALQRQTFCGGINADESGSFAERAWASAPPGFSEHATGYVVDFGTRAAGGCPDAEACFGATAAGRWLMANAPRFGFELSFPAGNRQKVKWEPWHWRWVGTSAAAPGAQAAREVFAAARGDFPANPSPGN